ncbi:hypothetical protein [Pengzhenrongella sicca]|uniref:Uncharacterized protein n=1 Tax=Pengzhenrongella sicca TaxID=2819238 RepID=A0A8A4Z942_9MICO|nr:hypothetical protein [Pengzhenrongella sicca]QTE27941.1 hypothetical protein J4E96_11030 [Pengzhenrongella sicca]
MATTTPALRCGDGTRVASVDHERTSVDAARPLPTPPGPATPPVGYGQQFIRDMGQGLAEIAVPGIAVLVVVGGLGLLGYALADGVGLAVDVVRHR